MRIAQVLPPPAFTLGLLVDYLPRDAWMTVAEAAEFLGVCVGAVSDRTVRGMLKCADDKAINPEHRVGQQRWQKRILSEDIFQEKKRRTDVINSTTRIRVGQLWQDDAGVVLLVAKALNRGTLTYTVTCTKGRESETRHLSRRQIVESFTLVS